MCIRDSNHAVEIYDTHKWPEAPLFYICNPSKTDDSVAPEGKENMFFLVPVSTELKDNCLLYTSDAADDLTRVDLGGRRIIDKKKKIIQNGYRRSRIRTSQAGKSTL